MACVSRSSSSRCVGRYRAGSPVGTHVARSCPVPAHDSRHIVAAQGLEILRGDGLKHELVQTQLGDEPLQLRVLLVEVLQTPRLIHLQAAELLAPAIVGLLCGECFL
jgi:hypothetical protein